MDWRDVLLITYSSNLSLKVCAYLLTLALITLYSGNLFGLLFLFIPAAVDAYGSWIIKENLAAFREDVLENMERDLLRACGIDATKPHYTFQEISGNIDHWMLKEEKALITLSMMAPKDDFVVITKRQGRIFPLKSYGKVSYNTEDCGTRDIYYSDICAVEFSGSKVTMKTSGGDAEVYTGQGPNGEAAANMLRKRVREYKALTQEQTQR